MTPETLTTITREAEEKYSRLTKSILEGALVEKERAAYISGASAWAERVEAIRAEVRVMKKKLYDKRRRTISGTVGEHCQIESEACDYFLSIIDKHLNL